MATIWVGSLHTAIAARQVGVSSGSPAVSSAASQAHSSRSRRRCRAEPSAVDGNVSDAAANDSYFS